MVIRGESFRESGQNVIARTRSGNCYSESFRESDNDVNLLSIVINITEDAQTSDWFDFYKRYSIVIVRSIYN